MTKRERPAHVRQGQIYDVDFPVSIGSVQDGIRPCIVTSSNSRNRKSSTVIVAIVTSRIKDTDMPEHVLLPDMSGLPKQSMAAAEQRFTVDKDQLLSYRGKLDWYTWIEVHRALRISEKTDAKEYE